MSLKLCFRSKWLVIALATSTCAAAVADDAELEVVRAKMSDMFEAIQPENVSPSPIDGWYTIHQGSIVAYVSADGRYLLQGDLIDLQQQVNLSEKSRNEARHALVAGLAIALSLAIILSSAQRPSLSLRLVDQYSQRPT